MKLALFSQNVSEKHKEKLKNFFNKPLEEVSFLFINTPAQYKPFKSDWLIESENRWRAIFPKFREFDLKHAYEVDPNFNFEQHLSSFDFIFISGGNTFLLAYWLKKTGTGKILKKLIEEDKIVYGGESAGSVITYKDMSNHEVVDDPSKALERVNDGLNVLDKAVIPHWGNPEFQKMLEEDKRRFDEQGVETITINDNQAVFYINNKMEIL